MFFLRFVELKSCINKLCRYNLALVYFSLRPPYDNLLWLYFKSNMKIMIYASIFQACVKKTGKDRKFMTIYRTFFKSRLKWKKELRGKFFRKYHYISIHKWWKIEHTRWLAVHLYSSLNTIVESFILFHFSGNTLPPGPSSLTVPLMAKWKVDPQFINMHVI